jgi:protein-disulfide isomerase
MAAMLVVAALPTPSLAASKSVLDEEAFARKIEQRVVDNLKISPWLQEQIQLGVQKQLKAEKDAQMASRADQQRQMAEKAKAVRPVDKTRDHIYGNPDAPVSLIEYTDYECPFCKRFHGTPRALVDGSGGQVNWIYRHVPGASHNPAAQKEAEAAECSQAIGGKDAFWKFTDAAYARTQSNGKGFDVKALVSELGLSWPDIERCIGNGTFAKRVNEDLQDAGKIGITGTPASIIRNNQTGESRIAVGNKPLPFLQSLVMEVMPKPASR